MTMTTDLILLVLRATEQQTPNDGIHDLDFSDVQVTVPLR